MADLFISYAREDKPRAEALANALSGLGYEVFWDPEIPPGQSWADYLESKLRQCKAMLVLWSSQSVGSQWVREEARIGRDAGKLIPVLLDNASPPFGFGEVQAANLTDWEGEADHADWKRLLDAISRRTGHAAEGSAAISPRATPQAAAPATPPPQPAAAQPASTQQPPQSPPQHTAQQQTQWSGAQASAAAPPTGAAAPRAMSFGAAVKRCLSHYVDGKGRAAKAEYWWFILFTFLAGFGGAIVDGMMFTDPFTGQITPVASAVVMLLLIAPAISVAARRLHDAGQTGWLAALGIIPYLGWVWAIVIGLMPGKPEANQYGPPPA